jgi:recombination protein RecT
MNSTTLGNLRSGAVAPQKPPAADSVVALVQSMKGQMARQLPKHLSAERLTRIVLTEIRRVPKLAETHRDSLLGAIMACSALGLEPGNGLGHAYLLPFKRNYKENGQWKSRLDCQLIIGYRGMIDLARRSGQILSLYAREVHANDEFSYHLGLDEDIKHIPASDDRGPFTHAYAVAKLRDGGQQFEVMTRADIEKIRQASKSAEDGPWVTHFEEMAKKTVVRRLFKWLPVSIELQRAVTIDEQAEAGKVQDYSTFEMEIPQATALPDYEEVPPPVIAPPPARERARAKPGAGVAPEPAATTPQSPVGPSYAQLADALQQAPDRDAADLVIDRSRHLPKDQYDDLGKLYESRFTD